MVTFCYCQWMRVASQHTFIHAVKFIRTLCCYRSATSCLEHRSQKGHCPQTCVFTKSESVLVRAKFATTLLSELFVLQARPLTYIITKQKADFALSCSKFVKHWSPQNGRLFSYTLFVRHKVLQLSGKKFSDVGMRYNAVAVDGRNTRIRTQTNTEANNVTCVIASRFRDCREKEHLESTAERRLVNALLHALTTINIRKGCNSGRRPPLQCV